MYLGRGCCERHIYMEWNVYMEWNGLTHSEDACNATYCLTGGAARKRGAEKYNDLYV